MAIKELRETRGIALLALAAYAYLVAAAVNPRMPLGGFAYWGRIPFIDDPFVAYFIFISAMLALALGLKQTFGESIRDTYVFLLHRPARRGALIGMKLLVGLVVYLLCAALPILVYSLWAARPGNHASPFYWWLTVMTWEIWFSLSLVYLAAFLSGLRPARWYGSRFLPIAAAALVIVLVELLVGNSPGRFGIYLVADAWLIGSILFVARTRDF
jgi:hypothetical protein